MENSNQKQEVIYSTCFLFHKKDEPLENGGIVISGFVHNIGKLQSSVKADGSVSNYFYLEVNAKLPDSTVINHFGEKFVNNYHSVTFSVSYDEKQMDSINQKSIVEGDRVMIGLKNLHIKDKPAANGKIYLKIGGTGVGNVMLLGKKKSEGSTSLQTETPAENEEPSYINLGYHCANCQAEVSQKVADYCKKNSEKFGDRILCFECQKKMEGKQLPKENDDKMITPTDEKPFGIEFEDISVLSIEDGECPF